MSGILFFRTGMRDALRDFYTKRVGMEIWLEQAECTLLRHGNLLLGFCDGPKPEVEGMITFLYEDAADVDRMHGALRDAAATEPRENERYRIYHFFGRDPEDRALEFQVFLHPTLPFLGGQDLLQTRRSVRAFTDADVETEVLDRIFSICRFAPTSMHSQSYDFIVVANRDVLAKLAAVRGSSSAPIGRAPLAVAVTGDPARSGAHRVDADIAAYHFMLAARAEGLGTCWIGSMDRPDVKAMLGVPEDRFVATVTPLGYPAERPEPKQRRNAGELYTVVA